MHIRNVISDFNYEFSNQITILYGGSVNSLKANNLFKQSDNDRALVGKASLDVEQLIGIVKELNS